MFQVEAEARAVLAGLKDLARRQLVRFELAVAPGLAIDGDETALRAILTELTVHAARRAAGGRVLVAASHNGRFAEIAVCDDARGGGQWLEADLRSARQLAVALGGTLEASPGNEGTIVMFRVPGARGGPDQAKRDEASVASSARSK